MMEDVLRWFLKGAAALGVLAALTWLAWSFPVVFGAVGGVLVLVAFSVWVGLTMEVLHDQHHDTECVEALSSP